MNPSILVVDDDGTLLHAMQGLLERCGYQVTAAATVADARSAIDMKTPDLLVMDLVLPEMDGRAGAKLLATHCPGLRVLFISGYTDEETMRMGKMASNEGFLSKPFSAEELLGAVERMLDGRAWDEASQA
jgi:two-component system cell cycle sensor histidine kinase/response regulator CckA